MIFKSPPAPPGRYHCHSPQLYPSTSLPSSYSWHLARQWISSALLPCHFILACHHSIWSLDLSFVDVGVATPATIPVTRRTVRRKDRLKINDLKIHLFTAVHRPFNKKAATQSPRGELPPLLGFGVRAL